MGRPPANAAPPGTVWQASQSPSSTRVRPRSRLASELAGTARSAGSVADCARLPQASGGGWAKLLSGPLPSRTLCEASHRLTACSCPSLSFCAISAIQSGANAVRAPLRKAPTVRADNPARRRAAPVLRAVCPTDGRRDTPGRPARRAPRRPAVPVAARVPVAPIAGGDVGGWIGNALRGEILRDLAQVGRVLAVAPDRSLLGSGVGLPGSSAAG